MNFRDSLKMYREAQKNNSDDKYEDTSSGGAAPAAVSQGSAASQNKTSFSFRNSLKSYRQNTATKTVNSEYINSFVQDVDKFLTKASEDYSKLTWESATDNFRYQDRNIAATNLKARSDMIRYYFDANKTQLGDSYLEMVSFLETLNNDIDNTAKAFRTYKEYASQYDSPEAFETAKKEAQEYQDLINYDVDAAQAEIDALKDEAEMVAGTIEPDNPSAEEEYNAIWEQINQKNEHLEKAKKAQKGLYYDELQNNTDFAFYSAEGAAIENPTATEVEGLVNIFGWRPGAKEPNNIVTYSRDNAQTIATLTPQGGTVGDLTYLQMTNEEVNIYNYLLAKEGKEKAGEYIDLIWDTLKARMGNKIANAFTSINIPVIEELATGAFGFYAGINNWARGVKQFFSGNELSPSATQYANAYIADSLDGIGKYAYQAANVAGNMAPSLLLGKFAGVLGAADTVVKGVGSASVGLSASGNAYGEALRMG